MADERAADEVDWVLAQSRCTAAVVFERLRVHVREDVQKRNGLLDRQDGWKFEFIEDDGDFEVTRTVSSGFGGGSVNALVRFGRSGRRIVIQGEDVDVDITAIVTIDTAGHCRLVVGEAMYSDWEIRRLALEPLFFEELDEEE